MTRNEGPSGWVMFIGLRSVRVPYLRSSGTYSEVWQWSMMPEAWVLPVKGSPFPPVASRSTRMISFLWAA